MTTLTTPNRDSVAPPIEPRLITAPFVALMCAHFLQGLGYSSMVLLPMYLDFLGATRGQVGLFMAAASIGGLLSRPLVGWSLDRFGRKPILVIGTAILAGGMALLGLVDHIGALVWVSRILVGVGTGVLFTGYFTMAGDLIPTSRRTEGIALFGVSGLLPLAANALVGRVGIEASELGSLYPVVAMVLATSVVFLIPIPEAPKTAGALPVPIRETLRALRARPLWPVWWATLLFGALVYTFMSFVTVVGSAHGVKDPTVVWAAYAAGAVTVRVFGARLPDRIGTSRMLPWAMSTYILAFVLLATTRSELAFVLVGLLGGVGHGYGFPVLASQTFTRSPHALRGSAMAAFTALWEVAFLTLVPLAGLTADMAGDEGMLLGVAGGAVLALIAWGRLERRFAAA